MSRVSEPAPARPARGWPSALVAFGVGTVLLVGGLELGLRATGWLLQAGGIGLDDAEITVLAEGDSFTYGIGGLGFPTQLQAMLEDAPELEAKALFEYLMVQTGRYEPGQLRTFQRRVREWLALHGPDKEVFFPQVHRAGELSQTDFTWLTELELTIDGAAIWDIDIKNGVYNVGGVDPYAGIRAALGF